MSKVESIATASPQYRAWLQRERRGHLVVRLTQLAILVVFLVLWEVLPKAHIVNPVLTSYPSALWPTFVELLKTTPQQASILSHTWATVLATVLGSVMSMVSVMGIVIVNSMVEPGSWDWKPKLMWLKTALYYVLPSTNLLSEERFLSLRQTALKPTTWSEHGASLFYGLDYALVFLLFSGRREAELAEKALTYPRGAIRQLYGVLCD